MGDLSSFYGFTVDSELAGKELLRTKSLFLLPYVISSVGERSLTALAPLQLKLATLGTLQATPIGTHRSGLCGVALATPSDPGVDICSSHSEHIVRPTSIGAVANGFAKGDRALWKKTQQ